MKIKLIIIICCLFSLVSCLPNEDDWDIGFSFTIINSNNVEYENVKVTIGGLNNEGEFVGTDSYTLPTIKIRNNDSEAQFVAFDDNRWKPNLNLVKEISDKAYFTVQLEGKEPVLLYDSFEDTIISAKTTENGVLKSEYGADLSINIYDDFTVKGTIHERY